MRKLSIYLKAIAGIGLVIAPAVTIVSCSPNSARIDGNTKTWRSARVAENIGTQMTFREDFMTGYKTRADITRQTNSGIPFAKYWMPNGQRADQFEFSSSTELINSFLEYDPQEDKDAKYNRATIGLQNRKLAEGSNDVQDKTGNVLHSAMGVVNTNTSGTPAQGNFQFEGYNFTNWAYVDQYTAWAGAINEGIIVIPSADIIDAAHINGTEILGIIYFDGYFGLTADALTRFFEKDDKGNYLIVDKLIEVADYFGFDGWFWNNEANATQEILDEKEVIAVMEQYVQKVEEKKLDLKITMYTDHGGLANNNNRTHLAQAYLEGGANNYISDFIPSVAADVDEFIRENDLEDFRYINHNMINIHHQRSNIQAGDINWDRLLKVNPEDKEYATSLATFALADTFKDFTSAVPGQGANRALNIAQRFREYDRLMFSGTTGNPTELGTTSGGSGIASVINERTTLINEEFLTNFSTGQGTRWFEEGRMISNEIWNHRGVMDVMPTYQWIIKNNGGNDFDADFTYTKAFDKGNALRFSSGEYSTDTAEYFGGTLRNGGTTEVKLFGSNISVTDQEIGIKLSASSGSLDLLGSSNRSLEVDFLLDFSDGSRERLSATNNGFISGSENWYDLTANLSKYSGKTIREISLEFKGTVDRNNVMIDLGEMSVTKPSRVEKLDFVEDINFEYIISDHDYANIRMYWDDVENFGDRFEIYQIVNGREVFLGTTRTSAFFLQNVDMSASRRFAIRNVSKFDNSNYRTTIREVR